MRAPSLKPLPSSPLFSSWHSKASVWRQFQNPHLLPSKKGPPTAWGNISCLVLSSERRLCGVCHVCFLIGLVCYRKNKKKISDITWAFEKVGTSLDWALVLITFSVSQRTKMRTSVPLRFHSGVTKITVRKQTSFRDPRRNRDVLGWVRFFHDIFFHVEVLGTRWGLLEQENYLRNMWLRTVLPT